MRKHRFLYILLILVFLFGVSVRPALSAYSTSTALPPTSITVEFGSVSGAVSSLGQIDQDGSDDNPGSYVLFTTPSIPHYSYGVFQLPAVLYPTMISNALLQVNFKGSDSSQRWTWSIYNWTSRIWIPLGDSIGSPANQWNILIFPISRMQNYISPTREVRVQLKTDSTFGDAKLDYEALHLTYLPITSTPTLVSATAPGTKPGWVYADTYTPTITFTPSKTSTPTNTFTPTATRTFTPTRTPTNTRTNTPTRTPTRTPTTSPQALGPLTVSDVNPRYFADPNGNIVYLTGSHTWCNFIDCDDTSNVAVKFNYTAYLDFLDAHNHNFFRLWRAENVRGGEGTDNFWFDPMPYARTSAQTNNFIGNKFNLSQFNQAYFDRMRARVIQARDRGMYVSIMMFDGWSVESKISGHNPWAGHPYNSANNINGIDGDTDNDGNGEETHTLAISQVTALQEAYVKKVIDTVHDLDNVLFEISNESPSNSEAWQNHMATVIRNYEFNTYGVNHPVGITWEWPGGNNDDLYNSNADWISLGGNVDINTYVPPVATGNKVIMADTDHLCGICGNRQWVWKSFTRGENPIYMDFYDNKATGRGTPFNHPEAEEVRDNLGYVRSYAERMDLGQMIPTDNTAACSTGYCLRKNVVNGAEYLVFRPTNDNASITVNLTTASGTLSYEWFNIQTGLVVATGTVEGLASRTFASPFSGYAVLYIYDPTP